MTINQDTTSIHGDLNNLDRGIRIGLGTTLLTGILYTQPDVSTTIFGLTVISVYALFTAMLSFDPIYRLARSMHPTHITVDPDGNPAMRVKSVTTAKITRIGVADHENQDAA